MTSEWIQPHKRARDDAEWAWVAGVYPQVPEAQPAAITRAVHAAQAALAARPVRNPAWQWALGAAAAIGMIVFAGWLTQTRPATPPLPVASGTGADAAPPSTGGRPDRAPEIAPPLAADTLVSSLPVEPQAPPGAEPSLAAKEPKRAIRRAPDPAGPASAPVEIAGATAHDMQRLRTALGDRNLQELAALVQQTAQDGLPAAPLLDRAMAGLAHAAPPATILVAVERRSSALRQARDVLGTNAPSSELIAGADALEAGAGASRVADIGRLFPAGRATAGLLTLAGLITDGVSPAEAVAAVTRGAGAGVSDAALLAMRADVMADVARGVPPLMALRTHVRRFGGEHVPEAARPADPAPRPWAPGPARTPAE